MQEEMVKAIREQIEACKGGRIWTDYVGDLRLLSEKIYARSSHFILELIQNAEDSGNEQFDNGIFEIYLSQKRVKVVHNGRPFEYKDVDALCGSTRTTKKPEEGTLGYLGIGFKSVFKITDSPEIYSGNYRFKFDMKEFNSPREVPWQIIPHWIRQLSEEVEPDKTTFILPFRREGLYTEVKEEVDTLNIHLYLFLNWLKKIIINNEVSGNVMTFENLGEKDGIVTLRRDGQEEILKVLCKKYDVDDNIKQDSVTLEFDRGRVKSREVTIAFPLDREHNLIPSEAGATYGGVFSFLPLGEERTGAKFFIQADFLIQPGREAILYEARWNHWLVEKVVDLAKIAIDNFKKHDTWRYQFLPLFPFSNFRGQPSFDTLFGPKLKEPLEQFLNNDKCVLTVNGDWVEPSKAVRTTDKMVPELVREEELSVIFKEEGVKYVDTRFAEKLGALSIKSLDLYDLCQKQEFLEKKAGEADATGWFRRFYLALYERSIGYSKGIRYAYGHSYLDGNFMLTSNKKLSDSRNVYIPTETYRGITSPPEIELLHPDILAGNEEEKNKIAKLFSDMDVKDSASLILQKISFSTQTLPEKEELLKYTVIAKEMGLKYEEIYVITKKGNIKRATDVFLSLEYEPEFRWEEGSKYVANLDFLDTCYLEKERDISGWYEFFKSTGVKDEVRKGDVEVFATNLVKEKFSTGWKVDSVEKDKVGYDFEAYMGDDKQYIEVKGLGKEEHDIDLPANQARAAKLYGDNYYLYVVASIPNAPQCYCIRNPWVHGVAEKLTVAIDKWKRGEFMV